MSLQGVGLHRQLTHTSAILGAAGRNRLICRGNRHPFAPAPSSKTGHVDTKPANPDQIVSSRLQRCDVLLSGVDRPQIEPHAIVLNRRDDRRRELPLCRRWSERVETPSVRRFAATTIHVGIRAPGALPPPIVDAPARRCRPASPAICRSASPEVDARAVAKALPRTPKSSAGPECCHRPRPAAVFDERRSRALP